MEHEAQPAFRKRHLIWLGGLMVIGFTLAGMFIGDVDGLIRNDVTLGPIIAATKIVIPIFLAVAFIYWLASVKKCKACGKILFWKQKPQAH